MSTVPPGGQYGQPQPPQQPGQYGQPPQQPQYGAPQQPAQPRPPRGKLHVSDIVRDGAAALLLIISLFYDWTFRYGVTDHWWVLIAALVLVAGLSITYLAHFGVLGANWNLGYNRLVRLGAGLPYLGSIIGLVIYDIVKDQYAGGFGPGAVIGIFAFALAVQPRAGERVAPNGPTTEDTVWYWLAPAALALSALMYLGTTLFRIGDIDGTLDTIFEIIGLIVLIGLIALPLIGFVQRNAAWVNVTAAFGSFVVAVVFLFNLFSLTSVVYAVDATYLLGDSFKVAASGAWLIALAGAAAFAPGNAAFVGERLAPQTQRTSVARGLVLLGVLLGLQTVLALYFTISAVDGNADTKYVVLGVISTLVHLVLAIGAIIASQIAGNPAAPNGAVVVGGFAGGYLVLTIIHGIVGVAIVDDRFPLSLGVTWVGPLLLGAVVLLFFFGLDAIKAKAGSTLQTMQVSGEGQQAGQPGQYGQQAPAQPQQFAPPAEQPAQPQDPGQFAPQTDPTAAQAPPAQPAQPAAPAAADPIAAELANPQLDAARLADIARDYPQHRAAVAAHPQAYPGLLEWLGSLGDAEINQAIANRQG